MRYYIVAHAVAFTLLVYFAVNVLVDGNPWDFAEFGRALQLSGLWW